MLIDVAPGLRLPLEIITMRTAFYGDSGAGKTTAARLFAKISPTSGTYSVNLRVLRDRGLIAYPTAGAIAITSSGLGWTSPPDHPMTARALQDAICERLPAAKSAIIRELVRLYPGEISRANLAAAIGVSPTSGSYSVNLADLNGYGFVVYPSGGLVAAAPLLFLDAA